MLRGILNAISDAIKLVPMLGTVIVYLLLDPIEDKEIRDKIVDKV